MQHTRITIIFHLNNELSKWRYISQFIVMCAVLPRFKYAQPRCANAYTDTPISRLICILLYYPSSSDDCRTMITILQFPLIFELRPFLSAPRICAATFSALFDAVRLSGLLVQCLRLYGTLENAICAKCFSSSVERFIVKGQL